MPLYLQLFKFVALGVSFSPKETETLRCLSTPAPMVTSAPGGYDILSAYANEPTSVSPTEVAGAVERVITAVATPNSVTKATIKVTQTVLASLFQSPHPDIIANLLPVCDLGVPFDNVDQFVLCTAAWKALSAAVVHKSSVKVLSVPTLLKIIEKALSAGFSMLLRAVSMVHPSPPSGTGNVGRWMKVAKFFVLHATRCVQVFSQICNSASITEDSRTKELFSGAFGHALRLLGLLGYACFLSDHEFRAIRDDLTTGLSHLVTSLIRSLLTTFCMLIKEGPPTFAMSVLDATHKSFANPSLFLVDKSTPCSPPLLHVFTTLQIMRYAASDPSSITDESNGKSNRDFRALRQIFRRSLCPTLFCALDDCYDKIVTVREKTSQNPLIVTIASVAAECFAVIELNVGQTIEKSEASLLDALLMQMSAVNPARAFVAAEGLFQIFRAFLARYKPGQSCHCTDLATSIMACSRMAFALRSAHAESRWLPLAARVGLLCVAQDDMLVRALGGSRSHSGSAGNGSNERSMHDLFKLRLVQAMCLVSSGNTEDDTKEDKSDPACLSAILKCVGLDTEQVQKFVVEALSMSDVGDGLTQCAVALAPHVMGRKRATEVVGRHFTLGGMSATAFCTGLNVMQPVFLHDDLISGVVKVTKLSVVRHGVAVYGAISSFISRGMGQAGVTERPALLSGLVELLLMLIPTVLRTGGNENDAIIINPMLGCVFFHAASALSSFESIMTQRGTHMNDYIGNNMMSALTVLDETRKRHLELERRLKGEGDDDWVIVSREADQITAETRACRRGGKRHVLGKAGSSTGAAVAGNITETVGGIRESLVGLLGDVVNGATKGDSVDIRRTGLMAELNEMRRTLGCIEDWCNNDM